MLYSLHGVGRLSAVIWNGADDIGEARTRRVQIDHRRDLVVMFWLDDLAGGPIARSV
jgi:hypothetical protein